jgi:hypothetical protein
MNSRIGAATVGMLMMCLGSSAYAVPVVVAESGNDRSSAFDLDPHFNLTADATIFNATTIPHASVSGANDATDDVDWYSFTGTAGAMVYLDIDCGYDCGVSVDTTLSLFDAGGTLVAYNDDHGVPPDPGSTHQFDSFIGTYTLLSSGTFYAAVSNYNRFPTQRYSENVTCSLVAPDNGNGGCVTPDAEIGDDSFTGGTYSEGDYILHVSNPEVTPSTVPEPTTFLLMGLGLAGLGIARRQRN